MNASSRVTFACPLSLVGVFYVVFPSVFFPITHPPLTLPWQAHVFWRLTDCGVLTGSVEQRSPGESNPLFLCLSECSFKEWLLLESCTSTDINLSRETYMNVSIRTSEYHLCILTRPKWNVLVACTVYAYGHTYWWASTVKWYAKWIFAFLPYAGSLQIKCFIIKHL